MSLLHFQILQFNLLNYGAKGDGVTDDAPAFQAALNDMATAGGGDLFIPPLNKSGKRATYYIGSPIAVSFLSGNIGARSMWRMVGHGAELLVKGANLIAFALTNAAHFKIESLRFYGNMDKAQPNTNPAPINNIFKCTGTNIELENVYFYGFTIADDGTGSLGGTNGLVYSASFRMYNCGTGSCGSNGGKAMFRAYQWTDYEVDTFTAADFYMIDDILFAFSNGSFCVFNPSESAPLTNGLESVYGHTRVSIRNCRFDEIQGYFSIYVGSSVGNPVNHAEVVNCKWNVYPAVNSRAISFYNVRSAVVKDCHAREGNTGTVFVYGHGMESLVVERYLTPLAEAPVTAVDVDNTVKVFKIVDCTVGGSNTLNTAGSLAVQTLVEKNGLKNDPVFANAARPAANSVAVGTRIYNSTSHIPNFSDGAAWRDAAGTVV